MNHASRSPATAVSPRRREHILVASGTSSAFTTLPTEAGEFRFGLRGAGYHADAFGSDATKFWASVQFRLASRTFREIGGILSDD